jgi:hypothetical protein
MEIRDLMIGDYIVATNNGKIERVISLSEGNAKTNSEDIVYGDLGDDSIIVTKAESIEPIPLTYEILTKNGFDCAWRSNNRCEVFIEKPTGELFSFTKMEDGIFYYEYIDNDTKYPIQYVHEMQHFLRFLKFNYILDNFKVE